MKFLSSSILTTFIAIVGLCCLTLSPTTVQAQQPSSTLPSLLAFGGVSDTITTGLPRAIHTTTFHLLERNTLPAAPIDWVWVLAIPILLIGLLSLFSQFNQNRQHLTLHI